MRIRNLEALAGGSAQHPAAPASADDGIATLDRRNFLKITALAGGGLAIGVAPVLTGAQEAKAKPPSPPQAFLIIAPDNTVTVAVNRLEFGQGVHTALPMALAEELDADWRNVRAMLAPAGEPYKDPVYGIQITGGSTALNHSFAQYRELGARARTMLVAAAAERWKVDPSTCRTANGVVTSGSNRATYGELAQAAMALPLPQQVTLKSPSRFRIVGKPTPRLDARGKLDASLKFSIDTRLPDMKVAVVARPPRFGGKVAKYDAAAAKAIKGVVDVVQIPTDRGGTGVAVVADGYWPAKLGRDALQVTWEDVGSRVSSAALMGEYKKLADQPGVVVKAADVSAIQSAAKRIRADYEFPYLAHAPMEPLNCTVDLQREGGNISGAKVWVGTQFQTVDQGALAKALGVAPEKIELNTMMAGGGFGRRAIPTSDYVVEAANVAKAYAAAGHAGPVKVIWSREDDIRGGYYRPMHLHRVDIGLDGSGKVLGWNHVIVGQSITKGTLFESYMLKNGADATMTEGVIENDYGFPMQVSVHHPNVDVPVLWWRSVGHTHTAFVMETLVDEVAHAAGQDPVAYRLARFTGKEHARHRQALQLAVEQSGYGKRKLPKGQAWGVAVHESFESVVAYVVVVSIDQGRPRVHRVTAGVHANRVINPLGAQAQIQGGCVFGLAMIAPGFAIEIENGATRNSNFTDFPPVRMPDAPPVDVFFVPSEDNPTGLGEPGVPPIAPAVANAVFTLTGKRLRKLPFDTV
ncbi:molybdopterin cofactor-binding domain-containing protein [Ralstonia solanacearum]|uniref:xanthine dehydrogenase family protein molybdopterin-binding subunit n=1 Tax=Ralstonia solanacearum TaxID=305 RepID=UPI002306A9E0|nr:xanthine dehydrogenase family protein molybdopterin-binding subunit [Ralstonia solanacearum]MDB0568899.1 xanthine dehydrogenase family protein molybdopterin-binding subunit [Ralstonia solanacearum]MDB0578623.1 xanthine dehydrogenase family protein molybdopterin-binding subunit [Ralstonia solanacearum]